jgi:hypothetical protein
MRLPKIIVKKLIGLSDEMIGSFTVNKGAREWDLKVEGHTRVKGDNIELVDLGALLANVAIDKKER